MSDTLLSTIRVGTDKQMTNSALIQQTFNPAGRAICDACSLRMLETAMSAASGPRRSTIRRFGERMRFENRASVGTAPSQMNSPTASPSNWSESYEEDERIADRIFEDFARFEWPSQGHDRTPCPSPTISESSHSPKSSRFAESWIADLKASASHAGISSMNPSLMQHMRDADMKWARRSTGLVLDMPDIPHGLNRKADGPSSHTTAPSPSLFMDPKHTAANTLIASLDDDFSPTFQSFISTGRSASDANSDVSYLDLNDLDSPAARTSSYSDRVENGRRGAIVGRGRSRTRYHRYGCDCNECKQLRLPS